MFSNTTIFRALAAAAVIAAIFGAAACGGTATQTRTFNIVVTGDKSNLGDISANKGDTINMTVSCDKAEEIHLHGYDLAFECEPGKPASKTFTADKAGQFEYEIEDTSTHLGNLTVNP
jgi:hypothetical protein